MHHICEQNSEIYKACDHKKTMYQFSLITDDNIIWRKGWIVTMDFKPFEAYNKSNGWFT